MSISIRIGLGYRVLSMGPLQISQYFKYVWKRGGDARRRREWREKIECKPVSSRNRWQVGNFLSKSQWKKGGEVFLICTIVKTAFGEKHNCLLSPLVELLAFGCKSYSQKLNQRHLYPFRFQTILDCVLFGIGRKRFKSLYHLNVTSWNQ